MNTDHILSPRTTLPRRTTRAAILTLLAALCLGTVQTALADDAAGDGQNAIASKVDLNEATADALTELPGIGPSKAAAIVSYRDRRPFRRIEEIIRVRGIGRATFRALRDRIKVTGAEPATRAQRRASRTRR